MSWRSDQVFKSASLSSNVKSARLEVVGVMARENGHVTMVLSAFNCSEATTERPVGPARPWSANKTFDGAQYVKHGIRGDTAYQKQSESWGEKMHCERTSKI